MASKDSQQYCMRPMSPEDLDVVSLWFEHLADLSLFDRNSPVPINKTIIERSWKEVLTAAEPRRGYWFTIDNAAGDVLGIVGIESINYVNGDGVLAVYLSEQIRRKGLGIRASCLLLDLAFEQLRLNRVTSYFRADNEASQKLTAMVGFSQEGVIRQGWFASGKSFDVHMVGILKREWSKTRKKLEKQLDASIQLKFGRSPSGARVWPEQSA